MIPIADDPLFPRSRPGKRSAKTFDALLTGVLSLFALGWSWGIAVAASSGASTGAATRLTANPFSRGAAVEAAFVMDAIVRTLVDVESVRGISGDVRVVLTEPGAPLDLGLPDTLAARLELRPVRDGRIDPTAPGHPVGPDAPAPEEAGAWALTVGDGSGVAEVPDVRVIVQVPATARRAGRIGAYAIGEWPFEGGRRPPSEAYATPRGFVEVTPETMALPVSEHFALRDFLTKGQADVWPKYVVLSPRLLDKLELTIERLEATGHPVERVGVVSGFRTPWYNAHGGNTEGRGSLSRHMYGDAMDFFVDNDGDGAMDDLTGDGVVDVEDARVIAAAAEEVEDRHPGLVGGIGVYRPTAAHRGFVHVDTRGYQARW